MPAPAMDSRRRPSCSRRRTAWLLWLALLLPLAQSAAALHGYAHVGTETGEHRDADPALQAGHCDLCPTAAALAGGGLPAGESTLVLGAGQDSVPRAAAASVWQGLPIPGYRSRAPPLSTR